MIGNPEELKLYLSCQDQMVNGQASEVMSRCCYLFTPMLFIVCCVFVCYRVSFAFCRMCSQG